VACAAAPKSFSSRTLAAACYPVAAAVANGARAFAAASEAAAVAVLPEQRPVEPEDTEDFYFENMSKFPKV